MPEAKPKTINVEGRMGVPPKSAGHDERTHPSYHLSRGLRTIAGGGRKRHIDGQP